ncbi:MAG: hypothetical protein ACE5D1_09495 [Fidelibacterota bacterium]
MNKSTRFEDFDQLVQGRMRGNQLMLSGMDLEAAEAKLLWDSPQMEQITWLDLDDNRLGNEGVKDLAECRFLVNVQYLNLNQNGVGDEGVLFLAQSQCLPRLKRLHLKNNPIQGEGILGLFNSRTLENLSTFQLHDGWTCKKREGWRYKPRD